MSMETEQLDYLTGLYNRKTLFKSYAHLPETQTVSLMYLDLDYFKTVNDLYGHQAGDELLSSFAATLQSEVQDALAFRVGGDEFVLLFPEIQTREKLQRAARRITDAMHNDADHSLYYSIISVSIGIVLNNAAPSNLEQLLSKADTAMYEAKGRGRSCFVFYDSIQSRIQEEKRMERQASRLKPDQLDIRFMPAVHMQNSTLDQIEACIYWTPKPGTRWYPRDYRPILEKTGFIRKFDFYIIEDICKIVAAHPELNLSNNIKISVQLSAFSFLDELLPSKIMTIIGSYQLPAFYFDFGIDETSMNQRNSARIISTMKKLSLIGFSISLYGFGKNFSGMHYLTTLPLSTIRFDREYLKSSLHERHSRRIVKSLIRLGKELKLTVITDGVTTPEEIQLLTEFGCDSAEGSFYTMPLSINDFIDYVQRNLVTRRPDFVYEFSHNLKEKNNSVHAGDFIGKGVSFTTGISDLHSAICFEGGEIGENLVELSPQLFSSGSYTISFWMYGEQTIPWGSLVYVRFLEGFMSMVPSDAFGISVFRISEDRAVNVWHDVICREIPNNGWNFITITYDSFSECSRYYINGRLSGYKLNVPTLISCRQVLLGGDPFQKSYAGKMSSLIISGYAKSELEVQTLYESYLDEPGFQGSREEYWMDTQ